MGNEISQTDANGHVTTFAYGALGRRSSRTLPAGQVEHLGYDVSGNLIYETNFNGVVITNQYDVMNRLTNRLSTNGYAAAFVYNPTNGLRTNLVDASGTTAYLYDALGRLTNKLVSWTNGPVVALSYGYGNDGMLTNLWSSTSGGVSNYYQYDLLGRLTNVLGNGATAAGYTYDLVGNLQGVKYGNGATNLYQYDVENRLTNLTWKASTTTLGSFAYQLGPTGNRTGLSETLNGTPRTYSWSYDLLYRLTVENCGVGKLFYGYDLVGNRTNRSSTVVGLPNQSPTYTANDLLTSDSYDNNGNTTSSSSVTYQYDALNHLTNINSGSVLITYDGDGNRKSKKVGSTTTYYLVDDKNPSGYAQVLEEHTASGGTTNLAKVYNYGLTLISQRVPAVSTNYFVGDGHGSTRLLLDIGGNVVNAFTYDAYGALIASNTTAQTVYLYCGEQYDGDLNFYYLRARYFNPNTDRFWTGDTFEGDQEDPSSLHRYTYCANDPINGSDPMGLFTQSFGYLVEPIIEAVYASDHPGDVVTYGQWSRLGGLTGGVFKYKPDIFNTTAKRWAEIKPFTTSGIVKAGIQYAKYNIGFDPFGYYPDAGWTPSKHYAVAGTVPIVFWNCGGIIFYSDALDQTEDLLALSTYALAKQYMLRNGAALATRTLIPALSRIGILAAGTPVAESAEETDMFAISTLITIF